MNPTTASPAPKTAARILKLAVKGLELWENHHLAVDDFLDSASVAQSGQRRTISSLLFGYFRHKPLIDALIKKFASKIKRRERRLLSIATVQILFQDGIAAESAVNIAVEVAKSYGGRSTAGFINAILRKISNSNLKEFRSTLPPWSQTGLPETLYRYWEKLFSAEQFSTLLNNLQNEAKLYFRQCQPLSGAELQQVEASALNLPWLKDFHFFSCDAPAKLFASNWLQQGKIYIQDPATALAISLINFKRPISQAIDLCAAPGGKSLMLAEKLPPNAALIALDRSAERQKLTRINFNNHGLSHHTIQVGSAATEQFPPQSFDLILIDAPCSNSGVFHRRPDAIWRWSENQNQTLTKLQWQILCNGFKLLKPSGELVYSTCSIDPAENSRLIRKFITVHPRATLIKETTILPGPDNDGAYAAKIVRRN